MIDDDIFHSAYVSISIPHLEKILRDEPVTLEYGYFAGTFFMSIQDPRTGNTVTLYSVSDISNLEPGDDWYLQYLISRMYIRTKNPACYFYDLAKSNIEMFENV